MWRTTPRQHMWCLCSTLDPSTLSRQSSATTQGASVPKTARTSGSSQPTVMSIFVVVETPVFLQTPKVTVCRPGTQSVVHSTRIIFDTGARRPT